MKLQFIVASIFLAALIVISSANLAQAQWSALDSGYGVTTNYHGVDVDIGQSVTATAGTTDNRVRNIEFRWLDPGGNPSWDVTVPVFGPFTTPNVPPNVPQEIINWANGHPGVVVWYAQNTQTPNVVGDWGMQAIYHDSGRIRGRNSDTIAIRATSFNVVPEVPMGTMVILSSMLGALGVFALKRKKIV